MSSLNRRDLLKSAAAAPVVGASLPYMSWLPGGNDQSLLVLELEGGNDGLNTVIPLHDKVLERTRKQLLYVRNGSHKIGGGFALHPRMAGLQRLFKDGLLSVVHGVGYPKPDLSHFRSRDIWHTADPSYVEMRNDTTGWLGRMADEMAGKGAAVPGLCIGSLRVPLALRAKTITIPSLQRIEDYQILVNPAGGKKQVRRDELLDLVQDQAKDKSDDLGAFLRDVAKSSVDNAERLREALKRYKARTKYPDSSLGRKLQLLARVVVSGFGTRIFHVRYGGFDTHASQAAAHDALLGQVSQALTAFLRDLEAHKKLGKLTVMVHSEFGRRVGQNASRGTDHGTAGPVLLAGGGVKAGQHGKHPDTGKLLNGDLVHSTDFRTIYGAICRRMGVSERRVLGKPFGGLELFS